jgi:hypothetical protein
MRDITPSHPSFKALLGAILFSSPLWAGIAHADDLIEFRHIESDRLYAKARCYSVYEVSWHQAVKSVNRYQASLSAPQIKSILAGHSSFEFERLSSLAQVSTQGTDASAMLASVNIGLQIKTPEGDTLSTHQFIWSPEEIDGVRENARKSLKVSHLGQAACRIDDSPRGKEVCKFDVSLDASAQFEEIEDKIRAHYFENPRQPLIIEVIYQSEARVSCSGKRSAAYVKGTQYEPLLILRD